MPSTTEGTPAPKYGSGWGKVSQFVELELPSGELCLAMQPSPRRLVSLGIVDNLDQLTKLVDKFHVQRVKSAKKGSRKSPPKVDAKAVADDPDTMTEILGVADKIVCHIVAEPDIKRPVKVTGTRVVDGKSVPDEEPLRHAERVEGQVYTDMIADVDKLFIFQYAVGVSPDLAEFRRQFNETPGTMGDLLEMVTAAVDVSGD